MMLSYEISLPTQTGVDFVSLALEMKMIPQDLITSLIEYAVENPNEVKEWCRKQKGTMDEDQKI